VHPRAGAEAAHRPQDRHRRQHGHLPVLGACVCVTVCAVRWGVAGQRRRPLPCAGGEEF